VKRDAVAGALLLAVLVAVSLLGHRPEGPKAATHASGDYSFGGYRAWYELMAREGVGVTRFRRHHDALRENKIDTLVVAFPDAPVRSAWDANEHAALRAWVRGGGRLVDIGLWPSSGKDNAKGELVFLDNAQGAKRGAKRGGARGPRSSARSATAASCGSSPRSTRASRRCSPTAAARWRYVTATAAAR
jgi:hypothetical protein